MNEAGVAVPMVVGLRIGECNVKFKIPIVIRNLLEIIHIEQLFARATAIPESGFSLCMQILELVEDVGAHRGHARAAANEHHLVVGVLYEKFAVRPGNHHLVAWL